MPKEAVGRDVYMSLSGRGVLVEPCGHLCFCIELSWGHRNTRWPCLP